MCNIQPRRSAVAKKGKGDEKKEWLDFFESKVTGECGGGFVSYKSLPMIVEYDT